MASLMGFCKTAAEKEDRASQAPYREMFFRHSRALPSIAYGITLGPLGLPLGYALKRRARQKFDEDPDYKPGFFTRQSNNLVRGGVLGTSIALGRIISMNMR